MAETNILKNLKNNIIVSLQAAHNEPLYDENCIIALAKTIVEMGQIEALRLAGTRDIKNIKKMYPNVVVIGITKPDIIPDNYKEIVYITPNVKDCQSLIEAGADIIAFDATNRIRPNNETIKDLIDYIKSKNKFAMADVATYEEAKNACNLGVDIISTTLSGYTKETENKPNEPDFELMKKMQNLNAFKILEGKIWEKNEVKTAFKSGADAVVIGSAITRPHLIAKRFKEALS